MLIISEEYIPSSFSDMDPVVYARHHMMPNPPRVLNLQVDPLLTDPRTTPSETTQKCHANPPT